LLTLSQAAFPEVIDVLNNRNGDLRDASQFFAPSEVDTRMRALTAWVKEKGVRDFEAVPLYAEQLGRETVQVIEAFTARLAAARAQADADGNTSSGIKRAIIKGMPRTALLKPAHAPFRLQAQRFELGDRVIVVADSGNVPMSARGVVIGLNTSSVDVVFDLPFLSGSRLGDRCSPYRGATLAFDAILNLTQPQFVSGPTSAATNSNAASPLERTVGESNGRGGASAGRGRGRGRGAGNGVGQPFRPPNMMRAAPAAPRAPGGVAILQRPSAAAGAAPVRPDVAFSGVAGGKEKPSARHAEQQRNVNPHLAALSLSKNGALGGNVPRGPRADAAVPTQPRGGAAGGRGGRGAAPAARGRGGRAPAASTQN
jgi:5'-3' exoribonuclease 1